MRCIKESFIDRYIEILSRKVREELDEKLDEIFFFAEGIEKADEITNNLTRRS